MLCCAVLRTLPRLMCSATASPASAAIHAYPRFPACTGGYLEDLSDTVVAVVDPHGGHHADLQWDSPHDPPSLRAARRTERRLLAQWLAAYQPGVTDQ